MVRRMRLTGRTGFLTLGAVAAAAAGVLGSRVLTKPSAPTRAECSRDPGGALGCYEQRYRTIVAGQGVAAACADLKARFCADPELQRLSHAITPAIGQPPTSPYCDVAVGFRHGDNACGSGYYHGVM